MVHAHHATNRLMVVGNLHSAKRAPLRRNTTTNTASAAPMGMREPISPNMALTPFPANPRKKRAAVA